MKGIWTETGNSLKAALKFNSFESAMDFMMKCVPIISEQNHHPEWCNKYDVVTISLTTHDMGNTVTEKDRKLALAIEDLYWQIQS